MVGPYIQFVRNLAALGLKKRGRHPVFNANQFYPFKEERELYEATREEFLAALETNIAVALNGERFGDTLEDLLNNPGELGKDFKSRVSSIGKAIGVKVSADFARQSEMTIGQPYYPPAVKDDLLATWEANFQQLCISAESDAKKEIARIVSTGKMEGWNKKQVEAAIREKLPSSTKHRAELIARTETGKLNSAARLATFKELGIEYYKWITTIDGRERHSHALMNKHICSVDDPTVYYEETPDGLVKHNRGGGMYIGNPGEDFQCRCSMVSWDPEIDGTYEIKGPSAEEIAAEEAKRRAAEEKAAQAAAEEAARVEAERVAREAAEKAARIEAERKAAEMARKVEILQNAAKRHESRSAEERAEIQSRWNARIAERAAAVKEANEIIQKYEGITEFPVENIKELLSNNYSKKALSEAKKLKSDIDSEISKLGLLENPLEVLKKWGVKTSEIIQEAVKNKLNTWKDLSLDEKKRHLEYEIKWVEEHKKYATWKVAQDAYKKELEAVEYKIKWRAPDSRAASIESMFTGSKSKVAADVISKIKAARAAEDLQAMEKAMKEAEAVYKKLHAKKFAKGKVQSGVLINGKTPRTLEQLSDCIEDYKNNNYHFDKNLYSYEDDIKQAMLNFFDKTDYGMDIYCNLLESVFKKGFLNTFQTGTSNGYNGSRKTTGPIEASHSRLNASHLFFMSEASGMKGSTSGDSYTGTQLERNQYEKYGHVIDKDKVEGFNVITHYGNCQVRFKKKNVNCTWTWDDSLCLSYQPSLTTDPSSVSMDKDFRDIDNRPKSTEVFTTVKEFQRKHGYTSYVELQYHGDVKVEDVESITFRQKPRDEAPKDKYDEWISKELADKFVERGVEIWYVENGVAVKYIPQPKKP